MARNECHRCAFRQDYGVPYAYAPCLVAHPSMLERSPDVVRAFLAASSEGWKRAASDPEGSAMLLVAQAKQENGFDIDPEMATRSAAYLADKCLHPDSGAWGVMQEEVWERYLSWLCSSGLLTTAIQSRHPDEAGASVSLDDLRAGRAGTPIRREDIPRVFTNEFLP